MIPENLSEAVNELVILEPLSEERTPSEVCATEGHLPGEWNGMTNVVTCQRCGKSHFPVCGSCGMGLHNCMCDSDM